ncbi:MAG TPA: hypothetical protein VGZ29_12150 [Terriglobia bacterium]|nr:hypothetical protein [Terriglobia bacterium]
MSRSCYPDFVRGVLIISRDWQSRALLRAQLIEEGCDVRALTSPAAASKLLARPPAQSPRSEAESHKTKTSGGFLAVLVLADISLISDRVEIDELKSLARKLPAGAALWAIASHDSTDKERLAILKGPRLENVLFRPIDAGKLVEQIRRRVQGAGN